MSVPRGQALSLAAAAALVQSKDGQPVFRRARVYERPWPEGLAVLIDGLWPRGLAKGEIDVWAKELAPSRELRQAYGHRPERQEFFRTRYRAELAARTQELSALRTLARAEPVVLLYAARDDVLTNGAVLWAFLQE